MKNKDIAMFVAIGIVILIILSYNVKPVDITDNLVEPGLVESPLEGQWSLEKVVERDDNRNISQKDKDDSQAYFKAGSFILDHRYAEKISYKLRSVNTRNYFISNYNIEPRLLNIDRRNIKIVNIYEDNMFVTEIVKLSDQEFIYTDGESYYFYRLDTKDFDPEKMDRAIAREKHREDLTAVDTSDTGLILGLNEYNSYRNSYDYSTIYIKYSHNKISAYKTSRLIVPRKTGFYELKMEELGDYPNNQIRTSLIDLQSEDESKNKEYLEAGTLKELTYLGNDYMSFKDDDPERARMSLLAMDYMDKDESIRLSDLFTKEDMKRIRESSDYDIEEDNIGLRRKNGYWRFEGRRNYYKDGKPAWKDEFIKAVPPQGIVKYDKLWFTWSYIKSIEEDALDAFVAPNKKIAVIEKKEAFDIYSIKNNGGLGSRIYSIEKDPNTSVIMAEWGSGEYASRWEDFLRDNIADLSKLRDKK